MRICWCSLRLVILKTWFGLEVELAAMEGFELKNKIKIAAPFEKMPVVAVLTTDTIRAEVEILVGRRLQGCR